MKLLFPLLGLFPLWSLAQVPTAQDTSVKKLDQVVISANRFEQKKSEVPYALELITIKEIENQSAQTTGDLLMNTGAVFVQKSQAGGGSPVLRGFEASRVLIVVDGVRMNNAIYRSGHLQDIITLDQSMLERVEVLFGPSSVMYGSDALGGAMCFYTKRAQFGDDSTMNVHGNTFFRWSSANNELTGHANFNLGWKNFASLTSFTYSSFDNVRAGNFRDYIYDQYWTRDRYVETINGVDSMMDNPDRNIQVGSAYSQYDLQQKFSWKIKENVLQTLNLQHSNSSNINRYDRLTDTSSNGDLRFAEWYYGPQFRLMGILNTKILKEKKWMTYANISLAVQKVTQERVNRRYRQDERIFQNEQVLVYSLNADFMKNIAEKGEIFYGLETVFNDVSSGAHTENILLDSIYNSSTRYPDGGSSMLSYAAYLSVDKKFGEKWNGTAGLRYSIGSLHAKFEDTTFFPFPYREVDQRNSALTWTAGIVYRPTSDWKLSFLNSSGFRTPNVDDLTKVFDSSPGLLIVPNPDLGPEKVINTEMTIEKRWIDRVMVSLTGWYSKMVDAMVLRKSKFNGVDSIVYNGQASQIMSLQNANDAYTRGITGTILFIFSDMFSLKTTGTYTFGKYHDTENDTLIPLDHIPPAYGQTGLTMKTKKTESEFSVRYNGWKELRFYSPSGEDNLRYATPYGMPSWITLNAKTSFKLNKSIAVNAGLENILDNHYRVFASGISSPGRNFYIALRGKF